MTAESVISQFMEIVHEHKNDSELMTCAEQAMIKFISEFFTLKAKKEVAMFFPSQENERVLTDLIYDSKKTLDICVFSITNDHIANAIYVSFKRGVKVRIITDDECMKQKGSDILDLAASGIHVRSDNNATAHMHNKFAIIDAKYLVNGSFNWTT
jgi:phosphatidylserine/phosphatidylglycerophosphate/cardiolipin synthase-like enzyme